MGRCVIDLTEQVSILRCETHQNDHQTEMMRLGGQYHIMTPSCAVMQTSKTPETVDTYLVSIDHRMMEIPPSYTSSLRERKKI